MDNRSALLKCALELFAARGYDGVGVQEVAKAAAVTKPTLYHYFGSKQGLMETLLDTYVEPLCGAIQKAAAYDGGLPITLEKLAQAYFKFARQNPVYYRMQLTMFFAPPDSEVYRLVATRNERQQRAVEALFATAAVDHANLRGRQRLYAATWIFTVNTRIGLWLNGYAELDDELVRRVVHQFQNEIY